MRSDSSSVPLDRVRRTSVTQVVLDQLLARIRDGLLRPGDRLPGEYELTQALGVGRSSVREALRGLITLGLVETRPGRGAVVVAQAPSPLAHLQHDASIERLQKWALLDLLEVRECLEGHAAQLAATRATPQDLAAIERHMVEVADRIARQQTYFKANVAFHLAIARASHNNVLAESLGHVIGHVRQYRERLTREAPGMPERDIVEHRAIFDAIRSRKPEQARELTVQHIRAVGEIVKSLEGLEPDPARRRPRAQRGTRRR